MTCKHRHTSERIELCCDEGGKTREVSVRRCKTCGQELPRASVKNSSIQKKVETGMPQRQRGF